MSWLDGRRYPSDVTDAQWEYLEPLIPQPSTEGRQAKHERRVLVNAMLYVLRSGCPWRLVPKDFPAWQTVYWYFRRWQREGVWEKILHTLRQACREQIGRNAQPSATVIDSQSIKTSAVRGPEKGSDGGKKNLGTQASYPGGHPRASAGRESDGCQLLRVFPEPSSCWLIFALYCHRCAT
ncbi:MAG TPA: IS5 family transposase [Ktedonobacteraceae bacterium]